MRHRGEHHCDSAGVTVHAARMHLVETTPAAETEMIDRHAPVAARQLAAIEPDLVVFGCTSGGSLGGLLGDRKVCAALGDTAGAPCIGVLNAVTEALARRAWRSVAVVTPYVDSLTDTICSSLEEAHLRRTSIP